MPSGASGNAVTGIPTEHLPDIHQHPHRHPIDRRIAVITPPAAPELFFSIVVPAHNEEKYLGATLEHLVALSYPADLYEVVVVENGSSDRTSEIAERFAGGCVTVFENETAGVSAAKNFGVGRVSPRSDWVVFLDADTLLTPNFLRELDAMLRASRRSLTVGTAKVLPIDASRKARAWFAYYDLSHRIGKGSYAIQIAKRSLFPTLKFDESLTMGEDLQLIKQARASGDFFFLPTRTVYTSTRRFDTVGYWTLFCRWTFVSFLPSRLQKAFGYAAVR